MEEFTQYLILLLIGLLFAKDYLLPPLLKKFGLMNGLDKTHQKLDKISDNELVHVQESLDKIEESANETLQLLKELKEYGIKIRKDE